MTSRDELIAAWEQSKQDNAAAKAAMQKKLDAAQKAFDEWEKPKKTLERVGAEMSLLVGQAVTEEANLRREVEAAMPDNLQAAIANLKRETASRIGDRRENAERAVREMEALTFVSGDLQPKIREILESLLRADLEFMANS